MMYESFESENLTKLISDKKAYMAKLTNDVAKKHLQQEILLLENEILPVVLTITVLVHHEVMKYCIRCFDAAVTRGFNGLLLYMPIKDEYRERPLIAIANPRHFVPSPAGAVEIYCNQVEILNMDGSGTENVACYALDIEP